MNLYQIIQRPFITEKVTPDKDGQNQYGFMVYKRATKNQIAEAVKLLFGVDVVGVHKITMKSISKKTGRRRLPGTTASSMKALVTIKPGQTITYSEHKD